MDLSTEGFGDVSFVDDVAVVVHAKASLALPTYLQHIVDAMLEARLSGVLK